MQSFTHNLNTIEYCLQLSPITKKKLQQTLTDPSQHWKLAFLAAFCLSTRAYVTLIDPDALKDERLGFTSGIPIVSPLGFILGGFLTGFGTRVSTAYEYISNSDDVLVVLRWCMLLHVKFLFSFYCL